MFSTWWNLSYRLNASLPVHRNDQNAWERSTICICPKLVRHNTMQYKRIHYIKMWNYLTKCDAKPSSAMQSMVIQCHVDNDWIYFISAIWCSPKWFIVHSFKLLPVPVFGTHQSRNQANSTEMTIHQNKDRKELSVALLWFASGCRILLNYHDCTT